MQYTDQLRQAVDNPHGVKAGQIWRSNDPRYEASKRTVQRVAGSYAFCSGKLGQSVRIRLDRFGLKGTKGYTLLQDV